ncbi:hypothetical protein CISG_08917 [Coccidioides immitis RMSCC 3703]|uniref:Amidohydrolase-related domain-containing protein n=1 Tax=Coccidioides immitis RMSCC 3703 TaxID=454286 RepID=A0A0J8R963_COCIT|nr:hypothetical protein CISG_08917 [Coccidioides immitis RMSCC 3703]
MAASNPQTGLSPNAWDSHMHIVDPDRYPLAPDAQYKPQTHTLSEAMEFESSVGIPNIVLVQPSIYGPVLPSTDVDPASFDPYSLSGFSELVSLLRQGRTYVKISAPYRLSDDPELKFLGVIAKELLRVAPDRLVFATDWPHTRFEGLDVKPFIAKCLHWCGGNTELVDKLFRRNAEELWGL